MVVGDALGEGDGRVPDRLATGDGVGREVGGDGDPGGVGWRMTTEEG
jgi:hypothetical protein